MANNTLAENLIRIKEAKEDIADAIVEMGGTASSTDGLEDMPDAIRTIQANPTLITKSITANGTYDASDDSADGYSEVTVTVSNSYSAGDEGKVVSSGILVSQSSTSILTNGTYDTTTNNSVVVSIPDQPSTVKTVTATYLSSGGYFSIRNDGYSFNGVDQCCVFGYFGINIRNTSSRMRGLGQGTTLLTLKGIDAPIGKTVNLTYSSRNSYSLDGGYLIIESNSELNEIYIKTYDVGVPADDSVGYWLNIVIWFT